MMYKMSKVLQLFLLFLISLVSGTSNNLTVKDDFIIDNSKFPPLMYRYQNSTADLENLENETEAPCRGTVNLASCFRKEHCIWLSGACVRRSASIPPPFALPVDIFATKERLEAIWLMSPYPILPPVPWKLTLVYSITYSLVMLIIIISKCIKTVFNFFRARRLRNLQLEQERAERERANHNQGDTIFIYYPNTETMLARNDILKTDEYQVVLVHRSLINGSLPDNNLIERLRHLSVSHGQQQIPVTNNGSLAQWNTPPPTVVILRQDNPENNETTV